MGRLERHLDLSAIARLKAGIRHEPQPAKKLKPVRLAATYRAARREAARGSVWRGIAPTLRQHHPPVRPNRSRKWDAWSWAA